MIDFIQIGSNVGDTHNDPIYSKVMNENWRGILVEPNPKAYAKLLENYSTVKDLTFLCLAISDQIGKITLFVDNYNIDNNGKGVGTSQHASCSKHIIVNKLQHPESDITAVDCDAITLNQLFSQFNITYLKLLCLDTEGYDGKILLATEFQNIQIDTIQFEYIHLETSELNAVVSHLNYYGYKKISSTGEDFIFAKD